MVAGIFCDRKIVVRDENRISHQHYQYFGICQGCPLSPFLFVILKSVLMYDATSQLTNDVGVELTEGLCVHRLLYADGTLLVDMRGPVAQKHVNHKMLRRFFCHARHHHHATQQLLKTYHHEHTAQGLYKDNNCNQCCRYDHLEMMFELL